MGALTRQGPGAGGRLLDFEGESAYDGVLSGGVRGLACTAIHHKSGIVVGNPLDETVSPKRARTRRATR